MFASYQHLMQQQVIGGHWVNSTTIILTTGSATILIPIAIIILMLWSKIKQLNLPLKAGSHLCTTDLKLHSQRALLLQASKASRFKKHRLKPSEATRATHRPTVRGGGQGKNDNNKRLFPWHFSDFVTSITISHYSP